MKYHGIELQPGEYISTPEKIGRDLGFTRQQIRTATKKLKSTNEITSKSTNKYTLYKVVSWDLYQDSNQQNNHQITINQPADNHQITTKQEHKNKRTKEQKNFSSYLSSEYGNTIARENDIQTEKINEEDSKVEILIRDVLGDLSACTGREFGYNKTNADLIRTHIEAGHEYEDFHKVIVSKVCEWEGTEYDKYLRPKTLFGEKFERYYEEA